MKLDEFFAEHPKAALAFSGGTDSAFLLYAARSAGADVRPYLVKSQFQPEFEYEDAVRLSGELGAELRVVNADILQYDEVTANPGNRCYFCKKRIMGAIRAAAVADGYETMIDGTNASDECGDRPGMKVLEEQHILSPLRICGLTKSDVRRLSKEAGLFNWDKPAYACLATRILAGEKITAEKLKSIEESEAVLFAMGFSDFRVRLRDGGALLQFTEEQQRRAQEMLGEITTELLKHFETIKIDLKAREKSK